MSKKLKIVIFDGTFKTTTFINRLCEGLGVNQEVYIMGFNEQVHTKIKNVNYIGLGSNNSKLIFLKRSLQFRKLNMLNQLKLFLNLALGKKKQIQQENIQMAINSIQPDIIHFQWISVLNWLENLVLPEQTKTILSQRGFHINIRPFINDENMKYLKYIYPKINGFHSVSEAIKEKSNRIYSSKSKIDQVVYSGFEFHNFPTKTNNQFSSTLKIISIGRNHWIKDYKTAILAIHQLMSQGVSCVYTIVGVDKDEELLFLVNDLGLQDNVKFINKVSQEEVYVYMLESDLCLLPSVEEGIANVCIEAMFCRLPVLSTNCGGMSELIEDGETGFLVPTRSSDLIAEKIEGILKLSNENIHEIIEKAREKVIQQHSIVKMVSDMENLYQNVIQ